ncbi:MAG: permease [Anaerolineae bacterium]
MDFASEFATQFSIFTTRFLGIFIEAVAFLLLGSLVAGLIAVFIRNEDIARLMPRNPVAAVFVGSLLGFIFPVCECGVVPVTRRLYQKGLPVATGVTFLLAAPVMNPIVLASTWSAFGVGPVLIGRFVITFIIAVSIGLLFTLQTSAADAQSPCLRQGSLFVRRIEAAKPSIARCWQPVLICRDCARRCGSRGMISSTCEENTDRQAYCWRPGDADLHRSGRAQRI